MHGWDAEQCDGCVALVPSVNVDVDPTHGTAHRAIGMGTAHSSCRAAALLRATVWWIVEVPSTGSLTSCS